MIPVLIGAAVVATGVAFALSGDDKQSDDTTAKKFFGRRQSSSRIILSGRRN